MTDMTIWWCEIHEKQGSSVGCDIGYWEEYVEDNAALEPLSCRILEMVLAPKGSLVIEKVDGEWPEAVCVAAAKAMADGMALHGAPNAGWDEEDDYFRAAGIHLARYALDALSVQSESQETP